MIYYRVALKAQQGTEWKWRSTVLTSLQTLLMFLRTHSAIPREQTLVFCSLSADGRDELLKRENQGKVSSALPASHFLKGMKIDTQEVRKLEMELKTDGDYDIPYVFSGPSSSGQARAWMRLLALVQSGALRP